MAKQKLRKRPLTVREILAWADAYRLSSGKWPTKESGGIVGTVGETWLRVDNALRSGVRGLPGGSSLAQLLAEHRKARNKKRLPPLTEEEILAWADAHFTRTGSWPSATSGIIPDSNREKWYNVDGALRSGLRGLPSGSSLAKLLTACRGFINPNERPPLTEEQILSWADAHHARTGQWPMDKSGPIEESPGDTWLAVDMALRQGHRGLPGRSSLARMLAEQRRVYRHQNRPPLTVEQILVWADQFHERMGKWPKQQSGPIEGAGLTWTAVNLALMRGYHGLPGGSSLAELLSSERGVASLARRPRLRIKQILAWADAHYGRMGRWPTADSGPVSGVSGENWSAIDVALQQGCRGLRGGTSLARLLAEQRGKRNHLALPRLSINKILTWADQYFECRGDWPLTNSGPVLDAPGETWAAINNALLRGLRGLPGNDSLPRLLERKRGVPCRPGPRRRRVVRSAAADDSSRKSRFGEHHE